MAAFGASLQGLGSNLPGAASCSSRRPAVASPLPRVHVTSLHAQSLAASSAKKVGRPDGRQLIGAPLQILFVQLRLVSCCSLGSLHASMRLLEVILHCYPRLKGSGRGTEVTTVLLADARPWVDQPQEVCRH